MPNAALLPGKKLTSSKLFTNLNSVVFYFLHLLHCYKISRISRSKQTKILKLEFYIFHTFMFRFYFSFRTKFQFTRKENNLNPRENDCVAMVHIFDFEELYLLFLPVQTHTITLLKPNTEDFLGLYNGCSRAVSPQLPKHSQAFIIVLEMNETVEQKKSRRPCCWCWWWNNSNSNSRFIVNRNIMSKCFYTKVCVMSGFLG